MDDLGDPGSELGERLVELLAGMGGIGKDMAELGEGAADRRQKR